MKLLIAPQRTSSVVNNVPKEQDLTDFLAIVALKNICPQNVMNMITSNNENISEKSVPALSNLISPTSEEDEKITGCSQPLLNERGSSILTMEDIMAVSTSNSSRTYYVNTNGMIHGDGDVSSSASDSGNHHFSVSGYNSLFVSPKPVPLPHESSSGTLSINHEQLPLQQIFYKGYNVNPQRHMVPFQSYQYPIDQNPTTLRAPFRSVLAPSDYLKLQRQRLRNRMQFKLKQMGSCEIKQKMQRRLETL